MFSSTGFVQLTLLRVYRVSGTSAVGISRQMRWSLLFMGFQSSRIWDIHGHGYRIRQTPYASHRAISTLRVQGQEFHGENMTGKRRGGIFPLFPSLVFSYQDTTLPLTEAPALSLYTCLLLSYVYFCYIFVLYPPLSIPTSPTTTGPKHLYWCYLQHSNYSFHY